MRATEFVQWELWHRDRLTLPEANERLARMLDWHLARLYAALVNLYREKAAPAHGVTEFLLLPRDEPPPDPVAVQRVADAEFSRRLADEIRRHNAR